MHDRKHNLNPGEASHRTQDHVHEPHDRRHDRDLDAAAADDHDGERNLRLSAKSLAARGDAPDGSEDGAAAPSGEDDVAADER
jgi:hypothetical protein